MILRKRFTPEEIFTPRSSTVNPLLYIRRPHLEEQVLNGIRGSKHFIIHGESGNGKSWLYKQVFDTNKVSYEVVNLANALRLGSLNEAFQNKLDRLEREMESSRQSTGNVELAPSGFGVKKEFSSTYVRGQKEPFEQLLDLYRGRRGRPSVIVLDNFEQVLRSPGILKEISDAIILLDDEDYSQYNVKLCIVGVPADIRDYLSAHFNMATISSRLFEVEEVARMQTDEAEMLLSIGLEKLLRLSFPDEDTRQTILRDILFVSDRIASELQEIGLFVAQNAMKTDGSITEDVVDEAIGSWITHSHMAIRQTIEARLNSRETSLGRRNQCIYCLGLMENEEFRYTDVEATLRTQFPESTRNTLLNVAGMLAELASSTNAPIKRVPKGDAYRFTNPKYRMAIRSTLKKLENERVVKNERRL